jgi:hypothetical protein
MSDPEVGAGRPRSDDISRKMFFSDGGGGVGGFTEKHKP